MEEYKIQAPNMPRQFLVVKMTWNNKPFQSNNEKLHFQMVAVVVHVKTKLINVNLANV